MRKTLTMKTWSNCVDICCLARDEKVKEWKDRQGELIEGGTRLTTDATVDENIYAVENEVTIIRMLNKIMRVMATCLCFSSISLLRFYTDVRVIRISTSITFCAFTWFVLQSASMRF